MNCLELAMKAANGKLTEQEILDAFEKEGKIREALIEAGKTDNIEQRIASQIMRDAMDKKVEAARLKRQVAQNIRVRAKLDAKVSTFTAAGLSPKKAIITLWEGSQQAIKGARENGYAQSLAYEAKWIGSALATVQKERPHILSLFSNKNFDNDVTREMWELREGGTPGKTGNSDAAWLARVLGAHMEMSRTELNALGAAIGKLDGYAGPQVHDDMAMALTTSAKWADFIFPLLDVQRSFPDAASEAEVKKILGDTFDTIITGVSNDTSPLLKGQRVGPANLATRLGKHRVLHFRDADAAIQYRDTHGRGSTIQGIFGSLKHQSRMAGAMDMFGPNPKAMLLSIAASQQKALKEKIAGMPEGKARDKLRKQMNELSSADGEVATLKSTIDAITGLAGRPVHIGWATIGENIRSWNGMAKLGGAVITAMPTDTVTMATAAMFRGQGFWNGMARSLGEIASRNDAQSREIGYLMGEGFDGITGHLAASYADGVPGTMSKTVQAFYKWSGLSGWTDTARAASARVIAAHLGQHVGKGFDALDPSLRHVLELNGINPAKWDALRSGAAKHVNGNHYLTPDVARSVDESLVEATVADELAQARAVMKPEKFATKRAKIIERARKDLELDLHRYYADETSYAVVETDAASRRFTTAGYRPGTLAGEAMRYVMQFKGFPVAFSQRIMGRAILNAPAGRASQAMHLGALMAGLTVAGYAAMTAKDMARGVWPPRQPFGEADPYGYKTFVAAATQGGAFGIYGDFLFGSRSRFNQGALETLSGPTIGTFSDLFQMWQDAREGNPKAGIWLDTAINNTPWINMFYTRAALDILFVNSIREAVKPGYLKRQERFLRDERGQRYVIPRTLGEVLN